MGGTNYKLNSVEVRDLRASPNGQFLTNVISEDHKGICKGDSGGPLTYQVEGRHVLIGATSFGSECGTSGTFRSAFTRVSFYTDWINKHMENPKFCSKKTKPTYNCRGTSLSCQVNNRYGQIETCSFRSPSGVRYDVEPDLNRDGVTYSGKNSKRNCAIKLHEISKENLGWWRCKEMRRYVSPDGSKYSRVTQRYRRLDTSYCSPVGA